VIFHFNHTVTIQKTTMLKILKLAAVMTLPAVNGYAQSAALSIVKGNVDRPYVTDVRLYKVVDGTYSEIAKQSLNDRHDYAFAVPDVKEGFYYISDGLKMQEVYTRIYLKGGEQIDLNLHKNGYDMQGGSGENKLLDQWQQLSAQIMVPAYEFWTDRTGYTAFFPRLNAFIPQATAFKEGIHTGNAAFNDLMRFVVDNDVESAALEFISTPRVVHPKWAELPSFYKTIRQDKKFCNADILQLGDGAMNRLSIYTGFCLRMDKEEGKPDNKVMTRDAFLRKGLDLLCNDTVKGAFVITNLRTFRDSTDLESARASYQKYFLTDTMKSRFFNYAKNLATFAKGEKGFNFTYPDIHDRTVSMSDLKGKVILVDVWATWCGPCKVQLPYLKQLEEDMKGKNVTFVSISVDEAKDKEKWKQMVTDQQLGGIQLFAGGWSDFPKYYKITGIPRFMVFDQRGRIVNADSPRPSEPELKKLLDTALSD
jgi:thiol-disulfide isomerase/thioredoxin